MIVVCYGGGTNSTALIIEKVNRSEPIDIILFSDTGGERPETYDYIDMFSNWLKKKGYPEIIIVRNEVVTLEQDCLNRKALPAVAYGMKSCSDRWKIRPQNKWLKKNKIEVTEKLIGFDADEAHRGIEKENNRYPLIEWNIGRQECKEIIKNAGLPQPGKSSCFFCPNMKPDEVRNMERTHPELIDRALAMEANADLTAIAGLGRNYSWKNLLATDDMFENYIEMPCGCYDGD